MIKKYFYPHFLMILSIKTKIQSKAFEYETFEFFDEVPPKES